MNVRTNLSKKRMAFLWVALLAATGALMASPFHAASGVSRIGSGMISESVTVPPGYDTVYFSGQGILPDPKAQPDTDYGDTAAQAVVLLERLKGLLAARGMQLSDIVMMHAYLAPDPATGKADMKGWTSVYTRYFGTTDQPARPSRTTVVSELVSPVAKIEIEVIAAMPHKDGR